jgi:hypothetical protein
MKNKFKKLLPLGLFFVVLVLYLIIVPILIKEASNKQIEKTLTKTNRIAHPKSLKEQAQEQGKSDTYFSNKEDEFLKEHPWYNSLPKRTNNYLVIYDSTNNKFLVDVYLSGRDEDQIKKQVQSYLKSIGVDINKYSVDWINYPKAPNPVSE